MPRYDYRCEMCAEIFEASHPMEGPRHVSCPVCKTGHVHRVFISAPAIKIWWKDARSSSDSDGMKPRFMQSTRRKTAASETAANFGGV